MRKMVEFLMAAAGGGGPAVRLARLHRTSYDGSIGGGGGGVEGNDEMGVISLTEDGGEELAIECLY
jgi:hypothetical protein